MILGLSQGLKQVNLDKEILWIPNLVFIVHKIFKSDYF